MMVYHVEIGLLFGTLIVLGPLVKISFFQPNQMDNGKIGLADFPT
jgi:BCD family chlorophyll transporter-like MFS transporter